MRLHCKVSYMKEWLEEFKKPRRYRILSFWGPVGIAIGVVCILSVFQVTAESISFDPKVGLDNFIAGIILTVLGLAMSLLAQKKEVLAGVGLPTGISIFFWGIYVVNTSKIGVGDMIGWLVVMLGLVLIVIAFVWAPK